jgi:hypothetical protein
MHMLYQKTVKLPPKETATGVTDHAPVFQGDL